MQKQSIQMKHNRLKVCSKIVYFYWLGCKVVLFSNNQQF